MRKSAAIFFLLVLCFNFLGYRYVFSFLLRQSDKHLEAKLDRSDYDENSLVSIKAPFSIPYSYLSKSDSFERWDGEITVEGVQYKYVKRRFFADSVEFLCIPNTGAAKLKEAQHDYFASANDLQAENAGKKEQGKLPAFKNILSDYCEAVPEWNAIILSAHQVHCASYPSFTPQYTGESPGEPPKFS